MAYLLYPRGYRRFVKYDRDKTANYHYRVRHFETWIEDPHFSNEISTAQWYVQNTVQK